MSLRHRVGHTRASSPASRLGLLGGFELLVQSRVVRAPLHVQRLLAFLALHGPPLHRAHVAGRLWTDLSQEQAHACLRTTLWRMGQIGCRVVEVTSTHLAINPAVTVDARELETCAARVLHGARPTASDDVDLLTQADELLPDWYHDWVLQERERLHQLRLAALESAAEGLIGVGRYSEAAMPARAAVSSDPLRESAYRLLIRSNLGEGNAAEALRQFDVFRTKLERVHGLEPSPQMQELFAVSGEPRRRR